MAFSNPINIATASVEQIFERLCWLYSTFRSTFVFDAIGKSYPLSDITQLTRGKIPYPERFNEMNDYQLNAAIQGLQTSDLICTREDWILRGRLYHTMEISVTMMGKNYLSAWKVWLFGNHLLSPRR